MDLDRLGPTAQKYTSEILGYLNFSSGKPDPAFLRNLNSLFGLVASARSEHCSVPTWRAVLSVLQGSLEELSRSSDAFRQSDQAKSVLAIVTQRLLPEYRRFHRDLLFHQTDEALFQPFFLGHAFLAVLAQGGPWDVPDRVVREAIRRLNDFIGHRPVAVLRTQQKIQPYEHEWVHPIPLYVEGAGVSVGCYHDVVEKALEILRNTPDDLLDRAWFHPELMQELAVDPRAYDFDHPVNRRPNYHFGGWDPHRIDNRGFYRRYVLQQVTLDALWGRVQERTDLPYEEKLFEAAAVLAGTILMGSGVTGSGPDTHDSSVSLATLLPHIAAYRDEFYVQLLKGLRGRHGERLRAEAQALRQPFGGARQHLNQTLARRRAAQLQHVHLARLFARMGFTDAAAEQARAVPVASARMRCEIDCRLTTAHAALAQGQLELAAKQLPEIEDLLHRAIECGAMVDPWNILGFGGQFSKFPAPEDSIHDHRVDELLELMNELFDLYARLEESAAAAGDDPLVDRLAARLDRLAAWWDQYASTEVSGIEGISGRQVCESAGRVAKALRAWHQAGTEAGNLAFWRRHAERFRSPEAYGLLVEALLKQRDLVASMALVMHWLSQSDEIPLAQGPHSFGALALRWMEQVWQTEETGPTSPARPVALAERFNLSRKFLDYLEANAEPLWGVPRLELAGQSLDGGLPSAENGQEDDPDDEKNLFRAAYENVTYRDTAEDGFEGEMLEGVGIEATDFELSAEAGRIHGRLTFLTTVVRLWKTVAAATIDYRDPAREEAVAEWLRQVSAWRRSFADLLAAVHRYRIPPPRGTHDSLVEYDRRRAVKEALLDRIISAAVETADAGLLLSAMLGSAAPEVGIEDWEPPVRRVLAALVRGDAAGVRAAWPDLVDALASQPLLYLPTVRGGNPERIAVSRTLQQVLGRLLDALPRLGLLNETYQLLGVIQEMERNHPAGPGAITEFDRLFDTGCRAVFRCLVESAEAWQAPRGARGFSAERLLGETLERASERLLRRWLAHSRNVRLSVLEAVDERSRWHGLKQFIQRYGGDLFTQKFMIFANLRAILHQGVSRWLQSREEASDDERFLLLEDLDRKIPRAQAVYWLELILEAVVENYGEYVDYNSTTTQSDRGEMLYTLLDFLRLEASYDRVAWNLRPVALAHEVLVRSGRAEAADLWREMVAQRSAPVADEHLQRLERLVAKYGMRLPSVADRIGERFVRPLLVDRLCALVRPAVEELRSGATTASFDQLRREIEPFLREPSGVGFDVPNWLESLEEEVRKLRADPAEAEPWSPLDRIPQVRLSLDETRRQIASWDDEG
jgi:hypothetical protein